MELWLDNLETWLVRIAFAVILIAMVTIGFLLAGCLPASAHSWFPRACCEGDDHHGDCHLASGWRENVDGSYDFEYIEDTTHFGAARGPAVNVVHVPKFFRIQQSPDGAPYICAFPYTLLPICAFLPGGS